MDRNEQDFFKQIKEMDRRLRVLEKVAGGGSAASGNFFVAGEIPTGDIDGANVTFTLVSVPTGGSVELFLNGQRQTETVDYTISGDTVTMTNPPETGNILRVNYIVAGTGSGNADTLDGANLSTDGAMASNSDAKIPSEKAVKTFVENATIPVENIANAYKAMAYLSANQGSLGSDAYTKINLNAEEYDTNNNFDVATGKYTAPVTGYYLIAAKTVVQASNRIYRAGGKIRKNNATDISTFRSDPTPDGTTTNASYVFTGHTSGIFKLTAGDYIELYAFYKGDAGQLCIGGLGFTFLSVHLLSV